MVGRPKGSDRYQALAPGHHAHHAVHLGSLERFRKGELRQNGVEPPGQHGFSGPRRADHDHVVASGGSDLHSPLHILLAPHITEVMLGLPFRRRLPAVHPVGGDGRHLAQGIDQLAQACHRKHVEAFDHRSFRGVFSREKDPFQALLFGNDGHGKGSFDRADQTVQRQFPKNQGVRARPFGNKPGGGQNSQGHGQVKGGALFLDVCRGQIHGDPIGGKMVS